MAFIYIAQDRKPCSLKTSLPIFVMSACDLRVY